MPATHQHPTSQAQQTLLRHSAGLCLAALHPRLLGIVGKDGLVEVSFSIIGESTSLVISDPMTASIVGKLTDAFKQPFLADMSVAPAARTVVALPYSVKADFANWSPGVDGGQLRALIGDLGDGIPEAFNKYFTSGVDLLEFICRDAMQTNYAELLDSATRDTPAVGAMVLRISEAGIEFHFRVDAEAPGHSDGRGFIRPRVH